MLEIRIFAITIGKVATEMTISMTNCPSCGNNPDFYDKNGDCRHNFGDCCDKTGDCQRKIRIVTIKIVIVVVKIAIFTTKLAVLDLIIVNIYNSFEVICSLLAELN
jgi:hypothetical protein